VIFLRALGPPPGQKGLLMHSQTQHYSDFEFFPPTGQAEDAHDAEPWLLERRHQEHVQGEHPGQAEVQHCRQQVSEKKSDLKKRKK